MPRKDFGIGFCKERWHDFPWRRPLRNSTKRFYVGWIETCDFSWGSWDGGRWKWCETFLEWLYPRKIFDSLFSTDSVKRCNESLFSFLKKSMKQMKKCLNRVEKEDEEAAIIGNSWILKTNRLVITSGARPVKKSCWRVRPVKKNPPKKSRVRIQIRRCQIVVRVPVYLRHQLK